MDGWSRGIFLLSFMEEDVEHFLLNYLLYWQYSTGYLYYQLFSEYPSNCSFFRDF